MTSVEKLQLEVPIINVVNTFKYVYFFGAIKDKLIKEELAKPFEVGKIIRVKGKYLKFNTS